MSEQKIEFCIHYLIFLYSLLFPLSTLFLSSFSFFLSSSFSCHRFSSVFLPFLFFLFLFLFFLFVFEMKPLFCQLVIYYFLIFNSRLAQRLLVYVFCFFPRCFKCSKPKHNTLSKLVCSSITLHFE